MMMYILPSMILSIDWSWVFWGLGVAYFTMIVALIVTVLSENRDPVKALAWIMALVLFPVGGALLYIIFGKSLRNMRMISRRNRKRLLNGKHRLPLPKIGEGVTAETLQCVRLGYAVDDATLYRSNTIEIFTDGESHFEALFEDLRNATCYINLQFYIIANDNLGRRLRDILIERAEAGVKIKVIYDYIGSFDARRRDFFMRLKDHGVEVHSFFRLQFPEKINRLNWRNHRKVVVIDGKIGYIGGMNVADRYVDGGVFGKWRDTAVRLTGEAVAGLQYNFAVDWKFMGHSLLTDEGPCGNVTPSVGPDAIHGVMVQLVTSGPTNRWGNTSMLFFKAIAGARKRVLVQTPYFLPSGGLLRALQSAALAGVDVRVMVPEKADSALLTYASCSYMEESLLAGIKVYMYKPGMLHAKVLLVDDEFSTLGSTNFDFRSFEHNFEENIVMYSREVNKQLAARFFEDASESVRLRLSDWNSRPKLSKAKESICRLLSPIL